MDDIGNDNNDQILITKFSHGVNVILIYLLTPQAYTWLETEDNSMTM